MTEAPSPLVADPRDGRFGGIVTLDGSNLPGPFVFTHVSFGFHGFVHLDSGDFVPYTAVRAALRLEEGTG